MKQFIFVLIASWIMAACDDPQIDADIRQKQQAELEWSGPCHDTAVLMATTTGSPDSTTCPNKLHHMRIEIASRPSNEEFGAVAFCECERPRDVNIVDAGTK